MMHSIHILLDRMVQCIHIYDYVCTPICPPVILHSYGSHGPFSSMIYQVMFACPIPPKKSGQKHHAVLFFVWYI